MRILVTNDDGIDSVGLHVLARHLVPLGDVVVAAPDREYSGSGAAFGTLWEGTPEVHQVQLDGIPEAWSIGGPPGLCVFFARLGVFGGAFDIVVSGINPGVNAGRAIYHSGTVGAALTARNGRMCGVAISQATSGVELEGQGWGDALANQHWETAAIIAAEATRALLEDPPDDAAVVNLNVPNCPIDEVKGWKETRVENLPPRTVATASLTPKAGHDGAFTIEMVWGDSNDLPADSDSGAVTDGWASLTYLSRLERIRRDDLDPVKEALRDLIGPPPAQPHRGEEWAALRDRHLAPAETRPASTGRGAHHIALLSSDVEATIDFYQGLLEFPLTELFENRDYEGSTHFFFDIGNENALAFFDFPGLQLGEFEEVHGGFHHLAISIPADTWERLRAKLADHEVPVHQIETSLYMTGPDGERIELISDPLGEMYGNPVM